MTSAWRTVFDVLYGHFTWDQLEYLEQMGFEFRGKTIYINGKRIRVEDVIYYYARDARNISSGCRRLGPLAGDWRPIDGLAKTCLEIYKVLKCD
jgi:hypothetical protein